MNNCLPSIFRVHKRVVSVQTKINVIIYSYFRSFLGKSPIRHFHQGRYPIKFIIQGRYTVKYFHLGRYTVKFITPEFHRFFKYCNMYWMQLINLPRNWYKKHDTLKSTGSLTQRSVLLLFSSFTSHSSYKWVPSIFQSARAFRRKSMWIFSVILANFVNFYTLHKIAKNSTEVMPYTYYFRRFIWKMYEWANSSKWPIF